MKMMIPDSMVVDDDVDDFVTFSMMNPPVMILEIASVITNVVVSIPMMMMMMMMRMRTVVGMRRVR